MSTTSKQQAKVVKIGEIDLDRNKAIELHCNFSLAREKLNELVDLVDVVCNHYDHYAANYTFETLLDALQSHSLDVREWLDRVQPPKSSFRSRHHL